MGIIAKYKFNNTLEANLLPEFNSEFTSDLYTVTDEVNGEVTTRTIESDSLPTLMRFGSNLDTYVEGNEIALLEVLDMNTSGLTNCRRMFRCNKNLTSISCDWDTSNVTNMNSMFADCYKLTSLDVSNFNTNNVTDMSYMFTGCNILTSLDVSNWDTSNVTTMNIMFYNCNKLTSLDVSNWNTSKVNDMRNMFNNCKSLASLDVSNFNTSNVTTMNAMFYNCNNLTSLDLSNFNVSQVADMSWMFYNCVNLVSLDLSNFNTSNVTSMSSMFNSCINLVSLDLSNFNTSNVINMYGMFFNCNSLTSLNVSGFDTSNVTNMSKMFQNCSSLTSLDITDFDTTNVAAIGNIFQNCPNLKYLKCNNITTLNTLSTLLPTKSSTSQGTIICKSDITDLDTTTLQSKYWNILDEPTLIAKYVFDKSIHNNCIPGFNTELNIEFEGYFIEDEVEEENNEVTRTIESCGMLPIMIQFGNSDGQKDFDRRMSLLKMLNICEGLIYCPDMFAQCENLLSVCDIDTSNVTTMYCMFYNCKSLTTLDVSNFNTSKVTDMMYLFNNCTNLTTLDVSNWDTSKVTTMHGIFSNCINLTSLDVSNFDTGNVTDMGWMFNSCTKLTSLDVSNFDTSNVNGMNNIFYNTPLLTDISVLHMDKSSLQKLVDAIPTDSNKTLWYKDVNIDGITHGNNITLKKYMEENIEIVLNSPLLEGDRIEVKDGKLCHVHKMGRVVLDGSEDWTTWINSTNPDGFSSYYIYYDTTVSLNALNVPKGNSKVPLCDKLIGDNRSGHGSRHVGIRSINGYLTITLPHIELGIDNNTTIDDRLSSFKQWLSKNPTTVVYELEEPYHEDITNLQSAPTLKTYLECSMEIDTDLPIDTNVTYRTNLSSVYVMERELDELDNGTDLGDILEGEVNE